MEEKNSEKELDLWQLWGTFRRCWWIMLIAAVLFAGIYFGIWKVTHTDLYTAKATLWVDRTTTDSDGNKYVGTGDVSISLASVDDYVKLIQTKPIYDALYADLMEQKESGLIDQQANITREKLPELIKVSKGDEDSSRIIEISVTTPDTRLSQTIAITASKQAQEIISKRLGENAGVTGWEEKGEDVELPTRPSNPLSLIIAMLVAILGAVVVFIVFLIRDILNDKISTPGDVEKYLGLSVLGQIPNAVESERRKKRGPYYYDYSN